MRRFIFPSLILNALSFPVGPTAFADFFVHRWENRHEPSRRTSFNLNLNYYSTSQNYGPDGVLQAPVGLDSYTRVQPDLDLSYGVNERFTLFGRASWASVDLVSTYRSGSTYGFADQTVGASFRVVPSNDQRRWRIDLQLQADFGAYSNLQADTNGTPYLGDASFDISTGAFLGIPFDESAASRTELVGGIGYGSRSDQFSGFVPWSAELKHELLGNESEGFGGVLGTYGILSLKNDPRANTMPVYAGPVGTGGSFYANAINPSIAAVRAELDYKLQSGVTLSVAMNQPFWGQAAPYGRTYSVGVKLVSLGENRSTSARTKSGGAAFVTYSMEAHVTRVNDRVNQLKIDRGSDQGIQVGEYFDIFSKNEAVARTRVISVSGTDATLVIEQYFREVLIEEGYPAKRILR